MHIHIILRSTAKAMGLKRYFPASTCKNGHTGERYTITGQCIKCFEGRGSTPDRVEYQRAYREENKESLAASKLAYYLENREKFDQWRRDYIERNRDQIKIMKRAYVLANRVSIRDYQRCYQNTRRAKVAENGGSFTVEDVNRLYFLQKGKCASCIKKLKTDGRDRFHVDHVMPVALGGSSNPENLQLLCPGCNRKKSAKHPLDWAKENGKLF